MSKSPNLSLPYILPSQAQKHVTHNEAIEMLDVLVQLGVTALDAVEPPSEPLEGQVVGVGVGASGAFEGKDGTLACRMGGGWMFVQPRNGFRAWVEVEEATYIYHGGTWRVLSGSDKPAQGIGVNTDWDHMNRLAVASPATLFTHEGAGHQIKVNKATAEDTASLLFQNDFSGRAEMGLAGDDGFSVKVSLDGENWTQAFAVDAGTGDAVFGSIQADSVGGGAVQSAPGDTTPGRLMRADWGYGPGNLVGPVAQSGGLPTGAVIERGANADGEYTKWADGTLICRATIDFPAPNVPMGSIFVSGSDDAIWTFPLPFASTPAVSGTRLFGGRFWLIGPKTSPADFMTSFRGQLASPISDESPRSISLLAIGTWF